MANILLQLAIGAVVLVLLAVSVAVRPGVDNQEGEKTGRHAAW